MPTGDLCCTVNSQGNLIIYRVMKSGSHDVSYRQMMLSDESFYNRESTDKGRPLTTSEVLQELSDHYEVEM